MSTLIYADIRVDRRFDQRESAMISLERFEFPWYNAIVSPVQNPV